MWGCRRSAGPWSGGGLRGGVVVGGAADVLLPAIAVPAEVGAACVVGQGVGRAGDSGEPAGVDVLGGSGAAGSPVGAVRRPAWAAPGIRPGLPGVRPWRPGMRSGRSGRSGGPVPGVVLFGLL